MIKKTKNVNLKILLGLSIFILCNLNSFAYVWGNWSECAFEGGCEQGYGSTMGALVVDGAAYFLDASTNGLLFMSLVETAEINGIDYSKLRETLYRTIAGLEKSRDVYKALKLEE